MQSFIIALNYLLIARTFLENKKMKYPYVSMIIFHFYFCYRTYFIQNVAYKGIDFIPLANPKFLVEILIAYLGLY